MGITARLSPLFIAIAASIVAIPIVSGCHGKSVDDYLQAGYAAMQANKTAEAEQEYSEAEKAAPDDPRVHVALGNLYVAENKPQPAQAEYMKVIDLDPKNTDAHIALGNLYVSQQALRQAEEQFRAAIALDPAHSGYYLQLANVLNSEGKPADAEAEIRTAIGLDPKSAQAHLALANLLQSQPGRGAEADAELATARILDPKLAQASPEAAPSGGAPSPAAAEAPKIKPINKLFLLTKSSAVYQSPDSSSPVLGQVHKKKYVHVIGIAGNFLQIKMKNGTIGFVPDTAAE